MAIYKAVEIVIPSSINPDPSKVNTIITEIKKELMKKGYGFKKNYIEAEVETITKYWWKGYTFKMITAGGTVKQKFSGGFFYVYTYVYPKYYTTRKVVTKNVSENSQYYEDTIDDKLGGMEQKLGV